MRCSLYGIAALATVVLGAALVAQERSPADKLGSTTTTHKKVTPGFGVEQLLQEYDRNKDGFLQREEVPHSWREHFTHIDTNKDGKLSREELDRGVAYLQPRRRPSDLVFVLIEMTDCDDDCGCEIQRAYDALRKLDKNNDGKLDADELALGRKEIVTERVDGLFKELDENKDGFLSREEVMKGATERQHGIGAKETTSAPKQASSKD